MNEILKMAKEKHHGHRLLKSKSKFHVKSRKKEKKLPNVASKSGPPSDGKNKKGRIRVHRQPKTAIVPLTHAEARLPPGPPPRAGPPPGPPPRAGPPLGPPPR